jgi:transcriptional regulator with XRE-family HTH domain
MSTLFADTLKKLRTEKKISQNQLAKNMIVNKSTVCRWENGSRLPDASMIIRLSKILDTDVNTLMYAASSIVDSPKIILVDDNKVLLNDSLSVLEEVIPNATIKSFIWPKDAIEYAQMNQVALAILDIELGTASGLDLCHTLLEINPHTNVVYLTAYPNYSLDAWNTEASGFMVKPLTPEILHRQLRKLRYPFLPVGEDT